MCPRLSTGLFAVLLVLSSTTGVYAGDDPSPLQPWMVTDKTFEQARYLELEGKFRVAAQTVAGQCMGAVAPHAAYLGGVLFEQAGRRDEARRCYVRVANADHPLAPRAAWRLYLLDPQKDGKAGAGSRWLPRATSPGLAGRVALAQAMELAGSGRNRAVASVLTRALAAPLSASERLEIRFLLARARLDYGDRERGLALLTRLAWEGHGPAEAALRAEDPAAALDLRDLRRRIRATPQDAAARRPDGDPGTWTADQRFWEGLALLRNRRDREPALAHLLAARDAGTGTLRTAATWHAARALEKLDRDLEAMDLMDGLLQEGPLPFATELRVRLGRLCLREELPFRARAHMERALGEALPGEDLAEAAWTLARFHRVAGDPADALGLLRLIRRRSFVVERSPWQTWGPLALYWEARTLEDLGQGTRARGLYALLWDAAPLNYYGVLARVRLVEAGVATTPPGPAQWTTPPLEVGSLGSGDREVLALPLALWRLGRYDEAREETGALLRRGALSPALPALYTSLELRGDRIARAASLRASIGTLLPPPWRSGARLWLSSLPVGYLDRLAPVMAADGGGMDPAVIAALIKFESSWNPAAVSGADAHGLMQLRPHVARQVAEGCMGRQWRRRDLRDPDLNLRIGAQFLREVLHRHHGNWLVALAAFNAGTGTTRSWLARFAGLEADEWVEQITYPNTVGYVKRILGAAGGYRSLYWPALGREVGPEAVAFGIPEALNPFLDEAGGRCTLGAEDGGGR
ncbi:MAG: transglycosylase SLT domain-containing protein [Pseudomonadota bacterium]